MADDGGPLDIPSVRRRLAARKRDLRERTLANLIRQECPHLADAKYNMAVMGLVRAALVRAALVTQDLQANLYERGTFDETGEVRGSLDALLKSLGLLLKYSTALGLTPTIRNRLGLDTKAADLDLPAEFAKLNNNSNHGE